MFNSNLTTAFDRMLTLSRVLDQAESDAAWKTVTDTPPRRQLWWPATDIYETETAFVLEADLPGVHMENIDIAFDRNTLTISGNRGATLPAKENGQLRVFNAERAEGAFSRSVRLPEHVDAEKISATLTNGVLTVTVPKAAQALPRKIAVKAA